MDIGISINHIDTLRIFLFMKDLFVEIWIQLRHPLMNTKSNVADMMLRMRRCGINLITRKIVRIFNFTLHC